jgi:hypothetical protein
LVYVQVVVVVAIVMALTFEEYSDTLDCECFARRAKICNKSSRDHKPLRSWVIVWHAQSQSAYLIHIVSIHASVVIMCVCKACFYFVLKCSDCSLLTVLRQ